MGLGRGTVFGSSDDNDEFEAIFEAVYYGEPKAASRQRSASAFRTALPNWTTAWPPLS